MSNHLTMMGNLVADPQLRDANGRAVCSFRMGCNHRFFDAVALKWKESEPLFMEMVCWGVLAENVAESLHKGDAAVVVGRLHSEEFTPQGKDSPVTVMKLTATSVGRDLRFPVREEGMSVLGEGEEPVD